MALPLSVVEQIRGKRGTKVRLPVIPASSTDPSQRKTIELVRDEIKLEDQEARADIPRANVCRGPIPRERLERRERLLIVPP